MGYDTSGAKSISPLQTSRSTLQVSPAREREKTTFMGLLKAIMAVCAADGKILRLQQLTRDACMNEENFIIALQKICDILGCYRLTSNISQDVIMQAVNIYMETSEAGGGGGGGGPNAQNYSRLQGLGLRPESDTYNRGYQPGQGNSPMGPGSGPGQGPGNGIPWPGPGPQGGQNGIQMPRGPPSGPGQAQRSSFNFDSIESNSSNRSSFNPAQGPGQGPGPGLGPPQNSGPNSGYGMRPYASDSRLNAYGSGAGRGGYPSEITEEVLNNLNMNSGPNSSRSVTGSLAGSSAVSFSVPDGNLSARITRASFPAPTAAQQTLQQDMARLHNQQPEFSQPIGANRMPNLNINPRIISPRLPLHLGSLEPGVGDRREAEIHSSHVSGLGDGQGQGQGHSLGQGQPHAQSLGHALQQPQGQGQSQAPAHNSQLNVQSSPFYPTLSLPINSANLAVIKNNAAAAAAIAAGQQSNTTSATSTNANANASAVGCLRTAGLSVITAAKIFWEHSLEIFLSIGNARGTIEDAFEAIVGKSVSHYIYSFMIFVCVLISASLLTSCRSLIFSFLFPYLFPLSLQAFVLFL